MVNVTGMSNGKPRWETLTGTKVKSRAKKWFLPLGAKSYRYSEYKDEITGEVIIRFVPVPTSKMG